MKFLAAIFLLFFSIPFPNLQSHDAGRNTLTLQLKGQEVTLQSHLHLMDLADGLKISVYRLASPPFVENQKEAILNFLNQKINLAADSTPLAATLNSLQVLPDKG